MLQPYCGDRVQRVAMLGQPHAVQTYADNVNGSKVYHFNSLGFRGEEFNPSAKFKVFAFGCSQTFGQGLDDHETWPYQFSRMYSRRRNVRPRDICLMNFGEEGASNDYIARMVLTQCSKIKPDLALIRLTNSGRTEGFGDQKMPYRIGPWLNFGFLRRWLVYLRTPRAEKSIVWERLTGAAHYYRFYSAVLGTANALRNLLLIQYYCRAQNIRCVISWPFEYALRKQDLADHPTFAPLISLIDPAVVCKFVGKKMNLDFAEGYGMHAGPKSNRKFAHRLMRFYESQEA